MTERRIEDALAGLYRIADDPVDSDKVLAAVLRRRRRRRMARAIAIVAAGALGGAAALAAALAAGAPSAVAVLLGSPDAPMGVEMLVACVVLASTLAALLTILSLREPAEDVW